MTPAPAPLLLRERAEALAGPLPALLVAARHLTDTALPGAHGRRRAGTGDDFWQFRPAQPMDGMGAVDWRRSARGDELFVREREWQAARVVNLWVDPGAAMDYASRTDLPKKAARAGLLAMATGLLLLRGGERVGLAAPGHPPRAGQAQAARLADALSTAPDRHEHGAPDLSAAPTGSQAVLFSDFLGDPAPVRAALNQAAQRNIRVLLVQILDPAEEGFPFDGRTRFESMSGHLAHETLRAGDLRAEYVARLAARKDQVAGMARQSGGLAGVLHTDRPAAEGLLWLVSVLGGGGAALMLTLGAIGFTTPALLGALLALPVLWWLLRAVPPAPVRRRFPGIALLLGLRDRDPESQRTPWWLLALRIAALAALILALAGPVLNPRVQPVTGGPLLVVLDASWASARDWPQHIDRATRALTEAQRTGRPVAVVALTAPPAAGGALFRTADDWLERLPGLSPAPHAPLPVQDWVADLPAALDTLWIADGLAHDGRRVLFDALAARGPVTVAQPDSPVLALMPPLARDATLDITLRRVAPGGIDAALPGVDAVVLARGTDPAGIERDLARVTLTLPPGATEARASLDLPPEQRNRITRFQVEGARGAGAVALAGDSLQRRKIAALTVRDGTEQLALLTPLHYLRQALSPRADLIEGADLSDLLLSAPDVVVLADIATLSDAERIALTAWVERGGLLLRFAGPRLAALERAPGVDDPLMPVALRAGGRTVGGAMSWGEPRRLAPFRADTPFGGLTVPEDVEIRAQVLAQPGPDLAARSIAELTDGTPLVTRRALGAGQVVLFHVTANADWSNLPISGLFVQMLDRLAVSTRAAVPTPAELSGTQWLPDQRLDGFGQLRSADGASIPGEVLADALAGTRAPGPDLLPGLYAQNGQRLALNALSPQTRLAPADWPLAAVLETVSAPAERPLAGWLLTLAALALMADVLATLALGGRLVRGAATAMVLALSLAVPLSPAGADTDLPRALRATEAVVLALVPSGDARVDEVALAGLRGLSDALFRRSSVEPAPPMVIDLEFDELALFPFLYWPVTENSPLPSAQANAALNRYLRSGGLILFDTRDAEVQRLTGTSAPQRRLRQIAAGLDIPALEPMPPDHVLTRTFYLLTDFPGRQTGGDIWVEAAPPEATRAEGMPFRILNDGVTPVVFGANDWAAAWAVDGAGMPMLPVGRGITGERQRELALRFGINLIMHVLSGNYKSDQVHVPELLQRLGN